MDADGWVDAGRTAPAVLFLSSDTGGGHRRAAEAVIAALRQQWPAAVRPVLCDPLTGPGASVLLRRLAGSYGPVIRRASWLWAVAYYLTNSRPAMAAMDATVFASARRAAAAAAAVARPAVIVNCHPLAGPAAAAAARAVPGGALVVTVVTDLAAAHVSWFRPAAGHGPGPAAGRRVLAAPSPQLLARARRAGWPAGSCRLTGLPVAAAMTAPWPQRAAVRSRLGLTGSRFTVLLAGGGEGCGGLARRARAIRQWYPEMQVVVACGRNRALRRSLTRLAALDGTGRLTVLGFTSDLADWLTCADLVITKAGPGSIAEAACRAAPMLLTAQLPGQERGNAALAQAAGAGRRARTIRALRRELGRLAADPAALAAMSAASGELARPAAAHEIAAIVARAAGSR